jgi:hypothetical protein
MMMTGSHGLFMFWCAPQSDIVHQSVYELVHSEDREELQRQLMWNSFLPPESANFVLQDILQAENCHLLERSFTVRFRCLLDNTSGFLVSPLKSPCSMYTCLLLVIARFRIHPALSLLVFSEPQYIDDIFLRNFCRLLTDYGEFFPPPPPNRIPLVRFEVFHGGDYEE